MVQLDREKLGNQIAELEQNQQKLNTLKNHKTTTSVSLGSVVLTDKENYYISIATNFCEIEAKKY